MATTSAWSCVSRSSVSKNGVTISASKKEIKANVLTVRKMKMLSVHQGLRVVYNAKVIGAKRIQNVKSRKLIICSSGGSGMNLVFVGAEVGPWSKTGGLGDVLGGLPPAMAVCFV